MVGTALPTLDRIDIVMLDPVTPTVPFLLTSVDAVWSLKSGSC